MTNEQKILTDELIAASKAYYGTGNAVMSDMEFDKKVEELRQMEEKSGVVLDGSPTKKVGAEIVDSLPKAKHEHLALSLDKIKYKNKESLIKWLNGMDAVISWKCDGSTLVLSYDNGTLTSAVTRGNGEEGSVVTHNAKFFKGIPTTIPYKKHLVVRGEAMMSYAEFDRINAENDGIYENPRNLATATIQMLDANESKTREIIFKAFELVVPDVTEAWSERDNDSIDGYSEYRFRYMQDRLDWLSYQGFDVVPFERCHPKDILQKVEDWKAKIPSLEYPTDGLVISYDDMKYGMSLGNTGHHFKHSIALKWTDETASTTINDIEWSVGKTGVITPVAVFDEVRLGLGSNVTRASLHNLSIMERLNIKKGSKAEVYLANLIIPQIESSDGNGTPFEVPTTCPICGEKTEIREENGIKTLHCVNHDCPAQQVGKLMNTFGKHGLFVKGLGESQIIDLLEVGLVTADPVSFYDMAWEDRTHGIYPKEDEFSAKVSKLWNKDGWGKKKWDNLINAIEHSRDTTLQKFLYSLNIPLLGNDLAKKLSNIWSGNVDVFTEFVKRTDESTEKDDRYGYHRAIDILTAIDGIGEEKATNLVDWAYEMITTGKWEESIMPLISGLHFAEMEDNSDNSLKGLTFVITGNVHEYKNRDEFKSSVEARGGKVSGSISQKTTALVNNDIESTSGKNKKAKELGIEIISEDEFINRYGK